MYRALPLPLALVALLGAASLVPPLAAQKPAQEPRRPKLAADADTNDPDAYYAYGQLRDVPWKKAFDAFHWAYRLDPKQTTSLYMKWQAMWGRQDPGWREEYRNGAEFVVKSKEAKQLEAMYEEAILRHPFVHLTSSTCYLPSDYEEIDDVAFKAYLAYDLRCYQLANQKFAEALALKQHRKRLDLRVGRARALFAIHRYDSAITEIQVVLDSLRARDAKKLVHSYETKAVFEYMIGVAHVQRRDYAAAREAFGRALAEDLSLYWVHGWLADVAQAQGDTATALQEFDLAVQLKGDDPSLRYAYGSALLRARRYEPAAAEFRKAIELEPYFAASYLSLAIALDRLGRAREAVDAYNAYLARAPRSAVRQIQIAKERAAALASAASAPTP